MITKLVLSLALIALVKCTADQFCLEKAQQGENPGTLYKLTATCQMCACDGGLRKFCAPDVACKQKKEAEYNAIHKRPCLDGGNRYVHSSQIQSDCNICNCRNGTWVCTDNDCDYEESVNTIQQKTEERKQSTGEKEKEKEEEDRSKQGEEQSRKEEEKKKAKEGTQGKSTCEDKDKRCAGWIRRSTSYCTSNSYVRSNCPKSCATCPEEEQISQSTEEETQREKEETQREKEEKQRQEQEREQERKQERERVEEERRKQEEERREEERRKQEAEKHAANAECSDEHQHCGAWANSKRTQYCATSGYVKSKCRKSCKICGGSTAAEDTQAKDKGQKKMSAEEVAAKKAEEAKQKRIEEWKQRLIAEGKVKINKQPEGCSFRKGGRVYPWGSQLQGSCGICTCRKRNDDYYFDCENC